MKKYSVGVLMCIVISGSVNNMMTILHRGQRHMTTDDRCMSKEARELYVYIAPLIHI